MFTQVPSLTPSLRHWIVRRCRHNKRHRTAYIHLVYLKKKLIELQSFLPSFPASSPASLQAALLQPAAQEALVGFYKTAKKSKRGPKHSLLALTQFCAILKLEMLRTKEGWMLVLLGGGQEGRGGEEWEGWRDGGKEEEEEEEEEEEGGEESNSARKRRRRTRHSRRLVYPPCLPHAPSLSPVLQAWLISLFRVDTRRLRGTSRAYLQQLHSLWHRF